MSPDAGAARAANVPTDALATLAGARTRARRRALTVGAALAAVAVLAAIASVVLGDYPIPPDEVLRSLAGAGSPRAELVVVRLRLPRALAAVLVGACLGLAGALFQRVLRNPLASPDVVGVGAGASTGAVAVIALAGAEGAPVSAGALAGALGAAGLIYLLSRRESGLRFVLIGVGTSAALFGVVSFLLSLSPLTTAQAAQLWLTGSLGQVGPGAVAPLAVATAIGVPVALVLARALPRLELGDDTATALGLPVERSRAALLLVAVALVGAAVAVAGAVSFVALVSGPIAVRLVGRGRSALAPAALVGAAVVTLSDLVARHLLGPVPLPVGVVTGVVGAPYLLWLLARSRTGRT